MMLTQFLHPYMCVCVCRRAARSTFSVQHSYDARRVDARQQHGQHRHLRSVALVTGVVGAIAVRGNGHLDGQQTRTRHLRREYFFFFRIYLHQTSTIYLLAVLYSYNIIICIRR